MSIHIYIELGLLLLCILSWISTNGQIQRKNHLHEIATTLLEERDQLLKELEEIKSHLR